MYSNLLKNRDERTINFSEELNININEIKKCEYLNFLNYECKVHPLIINDVKEIINKMNCCFYIKTNYFYNTNNKIRISFTND